MLCTLDAVPELDELEVKWDREALDDGAACEVLELGSDFS